MTAVRNILIILALAAVVQFAPGGGDSAALVNAVLLTLLNVIFVYFGVRFYRERRTDILTLDDRWRAIFYGALGVIILAMAARPRLVTTGGGVILWLVAVAGSAYALYRAWRHHREYG